MAHELIEHLLERAGQFNVELQIMPLRQPEHAGFDGPLQVLESPDNKWFGYAEGQLHDPRTGSTPLRGAPAIARG
ncbi:Scr1 family TA system antitoxin-like transcriptional regulator [Streptomyces sp. NPDC054841]